MDIHANDNIQNIEAKIDAFTSAKPNCGRILGKFTENQDHLLSLSHSRNTLVPLMSCHLFVLLLLLYFYLWSFNCVYIVHSSGWCYKDLNYINGIPCVTCALLHRNLENYNNVCSVHCQKMALCYQNGQLFECSGFFWLTLFYRIVFTCPKFMSKFMLNDICYRSHIPMYKYMSCMNIIAFACA